VADEVRSLSFKSNQFSENINTIVRENMQSLKSVSKIINDMASNDMDVMVHSKKRVMSLTDAIEVLYKNSEEKIAELGEINATISRDVNDAVSMLQFEDIVNQLTEHSVKRVAICGAAISHLNEVIALPLENMGEPGAEQINQQAIDLLATFSDNNHKAVTQTNLDSGTVDLF